MNNKQTRTSINNNFSLESKAPRAMDLRAKNGRAHPLHNLDGDLTTSSPTINSNNVVVML